MKGQELLKGLLKRIGRRFIELPQPLLEVREHPFGIGVTVLLQRRTKPQMRLLPPALGQMALNVAILMDRAPLVNQPTAYPIPERLSLIHI